MLRFEMGQTGLIFKTPAIIVTYHDKMKDREKKVTWSFPPQIMKGVTMFQKTYDNPHTAESFARLLRGWKK